MIVEKVFSDGTPGVYLSDDPVEVRARRVGQRVELAVSMSPGTFPALVVIDPADAAELGRWLERQDPAHR